MEKITIGPLKIPRLVVMGVQIWPEITLLPAITVFDPEWIIEIIEGKAEWFGDIARGVVEGMSETILTMVKTGFEALFDSWAEDFYARRGEEKG